jgi:hypothetical protein
LRLHVDQDALDFLKKFFSFRDPRAAPPSEEQESGDNTYFRQLYALLGAFSTDDVPFLQSMLRYSLLTSSLIISLAAWIIAR